MQKFFDIIKIGHVSKGPIFLSLSFHILSEKIITYINAKKEDLVANGLTIPSNQTRTSSIHTWNISSLKSNHK